MEMGDVMSGKFLMAGEKCVPRSRSLSLSLSLVIKNFIAFCTESCNKHVPFSLFSRSSSHLPPYPDLLRH